MSTSRFNKPEAIIRNVGADQSDGSSPVRIPLNRDHLTAEHQLVILLAQVFTVAPTANVDLMPMIESISFETDKGILIAGDGESIAELSAFTESQIGQRVSLGLNTTAKIMIDLHHEFDGALHDLIGALETGELSQCDLVIRFAPSVAALFTGGTIAAGVKPAYSIKVNAVTYPDLTGLGQTDYIDGVDSVTGEPVTEVNEFAGVGTVHHRVGVQTIQGTQTGDIQPIRLQSSGQIARFLQLITTNEVTGVRDDNIIKNVRLVVNGTEKRAVDFHDIQASNESRRNMSRLGSGVAVLDFGDDEVGYLDLTEANEAFLHVTIDPNAPTNWKIRLAEDYLAE